MVKSVHSSAHLPMRDIMGISVAVLRAEQAIVELDNRIGNRNVSVVAFLNANLSNLAADDPELSDALRRSLILNDGVGIDIASRMLKGEKFPDNLNGTDFIPRFLSETSHALRVYLIGARTEAVEGALEKLRSVNPKHIFVGARNGYFSTQERVEVLETIRGLNPDVVLIALGNPLQEKFADQYIRDMGCTLAICVGGLFDFMSEQAVRAPLWIRRLRSEWLYRLYQDPKRLWKRYLLGNPVFMLRVAGAKVRSMLRKSNGADSPEAKA